MTVCFVDYGTEWVATTVLGEFVARAFSREALVSAVSFRLHSNDWSVK